MLTIDGTRIWHVFVETKIALAELTKSFDSVTVCFSKGMGLPFGAALLGSDAFIQRAKHYRKMLGGGMRQSTGMLSQMLIPTLRDFPSWMAQDHANAQHLFRGLKQGGWSFMTEHIETNMVYLKHPRANDIAQKANERGVGCYAGNLWIRLVTHKDIHQDLIDQAISILNSILRELI